MLIAEDEETNFLFIEAILEDTKAELLWARNGNDAVEIFNQQKDIDLILMDIKMPEMDGITATRHIREINSTVPIIAQTAYAMSEDKTKCLSAGCDDYLTKPINHKLLLSTLEKYLNKKQES
ncbi:MAG: response regulator [Bacteroidetes bacterium]|nr:response regulator [Bacteroidota bacterium]